MILKLIFIILIVFSLFIGSFLSICIYRIPKQKPITYIYSYCPKCEKRLRIIDLIPILSYMVNKGKCRYCSQKISYRYPIIELLNCFMYIILYLKFEFSILFFQYAILSSLLIVISFIDFKYQIIPNRLNLLCLVIGIFFAVLSGDKSMIADKALGLIYGGGLFLLIALATKGAMGGGDIKLMGSLGLCMGSKYILLTSFLSFVIGGLASIILLIFRIKDKKDFIPFGPFISIAAILTMIFGEELLRLM